MLSITALGYHLFIFYIQAQAQYEGPSTPRYIQLTINS